MGKGFAEIEFHNTGLYNVDGNGAYPKENSSVFAITGNQDDMGRFKAPLSSKSNCAVRPYTSLVNAHLVDAFSASRE